jgi:hypothetical protein
MNASGLLFACLALITGSIVLVPLSIHLGVRGDAASALSSLSLLGGIGAAFLTVKKEMEAREQARER